jgi:carboxyl-terminal processing protease
LKYTTAAGRTVYGGGGIAPDVFVPIDSSLYIRSVTRLYLDGRFNNFVYSYYIKRLPDWEKYKTPGEFVAKYKDSEDAWKELVAFAEKDTINLAKIPEKDKQEIQDRLKAYLARFRWRTQGFYQVANSTDQMVNAALTEVKK